MMQLTEEQRKVLAKHAQEWIKDAEAQRDEIPFGFDEETENELALMKIALEALQAEPLGYIRDEDAALLPFERKHTCVEVAVYNQQSFSTDSPVYTAPPVAAPAVHIGFDPAGGDEKTVIVHHVAPPGWRLAPIEPTERMIIDGFESEPDEGFSDPEEWEKYQAMSGCEQAAHRARLCYAAMLAAAPSPSESL